MDVLSNEQPLVDALEDLSLALETLDLGTTQRDLLSERDRHLNTIRTYLLPRAGSSSGPLTVVFAGPTGSGKSTLINSIVGSEVTHSGVLRPTTRAPLVVVSPLYGLDYVSVGGVECDVVVRRAPVLESLALVDTPDIDSTETEHRAQAETLIDNADVVVFVTSALRYADAVPWQVLRRAVARGTNVIQVLNRVGSSTRGAVVDFGSRLRMEGMSDDIVIVPEHHSTGAGQSLPLATVRDLRQRIADAALTRDDEAGSVFDRVLFATIQQVDLFHDKVALTREMRAEYQAAISAGLSERVGRLSLAGVASGLYAPIPPDPRKGQVRRWRNKNRRAGSEAGFDDVIERTVSRIESDVRDWLATERLGLGLEGPFSVRDLRPAIVEMAHGWVEYVRRIEDGSGEEDRWLGTACLLDSATRRETTSEARAVHGTQAEVLVDRAERELWNRLEVIYERTASWVTDAVLGVPRGLDEAGVREALGVVADTAAPAYA